MDYSKKLADAVVGKKTLEQKPQGLDEDTALEVATAVVMGAPALVTEGLSWREVRLRALHSTPVSLSAPGTPAELEA